MAPSLTPPLSLALAPLLTLPNLGPTAAPFLLYGCQLGSLQPLVTWSLQVVFKQIKAKDYTTFLTTV